MRYSVLMVSQLVGGMGAVGVLIRHLCAGRAVGCVAAAWEASRQSAVSWALLALRDRSRRSVSSGVPFLQDLSCMRVFFWTVPSTASCTCWQKVVTYASRCAGVLVWGGIGGVPSRAACRAALLAMYQSGRVLTSAIRKSASLKVDSTAQWSLRPAPLDPLAVCAPRVGQDQVDRGGPL